MPDVLSPLTNVLAGVLATSHHLTSSIGLTGGFAWVAALVLLVVAIRSFRHAVAMSKAAPDLRRLQEQFSGKNDLERLQALANERRELLARHGASGLGLTPMLLQLPLLWSMYHLVTTLAAADHVAGPAAGRPRRCRFVCRVPLGKRYQT